MSKYCVLKKVCFRSWSRITKTNLENQDPSVSWRHTAINNNSCIAQCHKKLCEAGYLQNRVLIYMLYIVVYCINEVTGSISNSFWYLFCQDNTWNTLQIPVKLSEARNLNIVISNIFFLSWPRISDTNKNT